jgi:hypothetical protein
MRIGMLLQRLCDVCAGTGGGVGAGSDLLIVLCGAC